MITAIVATVAALASPAPLQGTPSLVPHSGPATAVIRQLDQCGEKIYAAGQFSQVKSHGKTYARHSAISFTAARPHSLSGWKPDVTGPVNSITLAGNCSVAWLGTQHGVAEVSARTGKRIPAFHSGVTGTVNTVLNWHGHLLVGGHFPGSLASLNPVTGQHDGFTDGVDIHGNMPPAHDPTMVYNMQLSPNRKRVLVEGNFTRAGHTARPQIFMLNVDSHPAQVTPWRSPDFGGECIKHQSFYIRDAAWSPDGSHVYIADTGDHALNWNGHPPQIGLCDVVAAFPSRWASVSPLWRNFFGCDSAYAVTATSSTVFAAGHFRWISNRDGCNHAGPHAIADHGLTGLTTSGAPILSAGQPRYSMSPANADNMFVRNGILWIASTNRFGSQQCDGIGGHSGICAIPLGSAATAAYSPAAPRDPSKTPASATTIKH